MEVEEEISICNPSHKESGELGAFSGTGSESSEEEDDDVICVSKFELPSLVDEFKLIFLGENELSDPRSNEYSGEGLGEPEFYAESDREGGLGIQPDSDFHFGLPVAFFLMPGESKGIISPFSPSSFSAMGRRERLSLISSPLTSFKVVCYSTDDEVSGASVGAMSPGGPIQLLFARFLLRVGQGGPREGDRGCLCCRAARGGPN